MFEHTAAAAKGVGGVYLSNSHTSSMHIYAHISIHKCAWSA